MLEQIRRFMAKRLLKHKNVSTLASRKAKRHKRRKHHRPMVARSHEHHPREATISTALSNFPRKHALLAMGLIIGLGLMTIFPSKDASAVRATQELAIPNLSDKTLDIAAPDPIKLVTKTETVKPGDNLSLIFQRAGLSDKDMLKLVGSSKQGKALAKLYPKHKFIFELTDDKQLQSLTHVINRLEKQVFTRTQESYDYKKVTREPDVKLARREGKISSSLYLAAQEAQLNDSLIMELASIYGWDIDFALDIRSGDSFIILYEEKFLDGEKISNGKILAAAFTNRGETYSAVRYEDKNGDAQYYTPEGATMRKEFLRSPIEFARISSHFNLRRKHPILNKIRAHKGTDYAAARGTPIRAAGDGKVTFAGRKGGYGNTLIIQHGQKYKTLYAHISKYRKGVRAGKRVKQGDVVAYVGATGLATAPHLHYEFYVNGSVRNPVTVKLPKAKSIHSAEKERFLTQATPLLKKLDAQHWNTQIATSDQTQNGDKL